MYPYVQCSTINKSQDKNNIQVHRWMYGLKNCGTSVYIVVQQVKNLTSLCEDVCSIHGLAQWVKDPALLQAAV